MVGVALRSVELRSIELQVALGMMWYAQKMSFKKVDFPLMKMVIFQKFVIFRKNLGGMDSSGAETLGLG